MKKTFAILALACAGFLSSCWWGGSVDGPSGAWFTEVTDPVTANSTGGSKVGRATATSYCGLIALGDASIAAAKKQGGISSVSSVDRERTSILGIISTYTTVVRGN